MNNDYGYRLDTISFISYSADYFVDCISNNTIIVIININVKNCDDNGNDYSNTNNS